ncbi:MAG: flavin reductase family protein [Gemmatimonadota bacterium]
MSVPIDPAQVRAALARFASGITVLTMRDAAGTDLGMTATAFTSLSLDPPLILACVDAKATMATPLVEGAAFAVHVLREDQEQLSRRFAATTGDRFANLTLERSPDGTPLLPDTLMRMECTAVARHPGGDHHIIVGRPQRVTVAAIGEPLLYFRGRYGRLAQTP